MVAKGVTLLLEHVEPVLELADACIELCDRYGHELTAAQRQAVEIVRREVEQAKGGSSEL